MRGGSPHKKVDISNNHQRLAIEALEQANLQLQGARDSNQFLEKQVKYYLGEVERLETELRASKEEAVKTYIARFYKTMEYQSFAAYWKRFGYATSRKLCEGGLQGGGLFPGLNTTELRAEFLEEVPQTPTEEAVEEGALVVPTEEPLSMGPTNEATGLPLAVPQSSIVDSPFVMTTTTNL